MITIGLLSKDNPEDRFAWSGTLFKMYRHLNTENSRCIWIPIKSSVSSRIYQFLLRCFCKLLRRNASLIHTKYVAKDFARSIDSTLMQVCDVLLAPGTPYVAYLNTDKPIVVFSDATFACLYNYYPSCSNFFHFNILDGNAIEKRALQNATYIVFSSNWAKHSAEYDYLIDNAKISVVKFGANVDEKDISPLVDRFSRVTDGLLDVLFLGVEWERKGGDIAVETVRILNEQGISARLHIVGIRNLDSNIESLPYIDNHGFLNKNNPTEYKEIVRLLNSTHILLLPTVAECSSIAFVEASNFGLPIFTYDTGGVSDYVLNHENGVCLPLSATPSDFASVIMFSIENDLLSKMSSNGIDICNSVLNWNNWGKEMLNILNAVIKK